MTEIVKEFPLANIERIEFITEEETPKTYRLTDVATEANCVAYISQGQEQELRIKNVIKAQNNTEDIIMGYDTTVTSALMVAEVLALVDGGTLRTSGEEPDITVVGYDAPVVGVPVVRQKFTTKIYTAEKDVNGDTLGYACFTYLHSKGTPVSYSMVDGQFFTPQLTFKSRPKSGESPVSIDFMETLPA